MSRAHNFCAGPCTLPLDVLTELGDEMVDYGGTGMSLIEMSHRGADYEGVHTDAVDALRRLSGAPDDVEVLLIQGGATLQFAMVPQNLLPADGRAGYVMSGAWAKKAYEDAARMGDAYQAWTPTDGPTRMPGPDEVTIEDDTTYLHVTSNETIEGVRLAGFSGYGARLVVDASSDYLARPIDWDAVDLVYGGAQKNLGPAGLAVVFVRRSLLDRTPDSVPSYLRYDYHAKANSLANTPPTFAVWAMGKVLRWMEDNGGVAAMEQRAADRSGRIYDVIDASGGFYLNPVDPAHRSHTNVVFTLPSKELESTFLAQAEARSMHHLKGHRSVGGMRASIYAALPDESVETLADFMTSFATQHAP
ncbi:MAG: 3-phosphoserine/phosphohydroxythreonine transaminase [Actinomycetota bacterium]